LAQENAFVSEAGDCVLQGDCLASPHYPRGYLSNDACSLTALKQGKVSVQHLDMQSESDMLMVNGKTYNGLHSPEGVQVNVGDQIQWTSDASASSGMWKICIHSDPVNGVVSDIQSILAASGVILTIAGIIVTASICSRRFESTKDGASKRGSLSEHLLSSCEEANVNTMLEPVIFDYCEGLRKLRCIRIAVPGRSVVDNRRSVESEVKVSVRGSVTCVHVTLVKRSDMPRDAEPLPSSSGQMLKFCGAWKWEKTFEFEDGLWELDNSTPMPGIDENGGLRLPELGLDMHGVVQIQLVRVPPPEPRLLKGVANYLDVYDIGTNSVISDMQDTMSDIGPSASVVNECCSQYQHIGIPIVEEDIETRSTVLNGEDESSVESSFMKA
jgi:hypothetical protein